MRKLRTERSAGINNIKILHAAKNAVRLADVWSVSAFGKRIGGENRMSEAANHKAMINFLDRIVNDLAAEELQYLKDMERHNHEIARLRTQLGTVRSWLNMTAKGEV
jgi:hypothetical protein